MFRKFYVRVMMKLDLINCLNNKNVRHINNIVNSKLYIYISTKTNKIVTYEVKLKNGVGELLKLNVDKLITFLSL